MNILHTNKDKMRKLNIYVQNNFKYLMEMDKSQCKHCLKYITGNHTGNLRKHLKANHTELYRKVIDDENMVSLMNNKMFPLINSGLLDPVSAHLFR